MGRFQANTAPTWARAAVEALALEVGKTVDVPDLRSTMFASAVAPPRAEMGDLAVPMFQFAKLLKQPPPKLAQEIAAALRSDLVTFSAAGPYVNVHAKRDLVIKEVVAELAAHQSDFGHQANDPEKVAVIDYSSPNIAKPLAFHHIRSTMIGNSIARILKAAGYTVHGTNFLGDWGTQFGYMIAVHEKDAPEDFAKLTLDDFVKTYIAERAKAKLDPQVDQHARNAFARLEKGDLEARRVWKKARDASLERFKTVYAILGVHFDEDKYIGESYFENALAGVIAEAQAKGITTESDGALIVDLSAYGIETPCLLRKSDGATLYATRDIAAAKFRHDSFGGEAKEWQSLYVVDQGQSLHFKQVFKVMELLGYDYSARLKHVPFGILLMWSDEEQAWIKGKTRSGHAISLEEVLEEATKRVLSIIDERSPDLDNKHAIAQSIGVGAVVFNDLKHKRTNDVKFKFDEALSLEGETGPYIHNALVRTKSILRKAGRVPSAQANLALLTHAREGELAMIMASYADTIQRAAVEYDPSLIARFTLDLAGAFHAFHHDCYVIDAENLPLTDARLALVHTVMHVLENAMHLIGLKPVEAM